MYEILYTVFPDEGPAYSLPRFIIRAADESHARDVADHIVHGSVSKPMPISPVDSPYVTRRTIHVREVL